jgi:hypothetical protein
MGTLIALKNVGPDGRASGKAEFLDPTTGRVFADEGGLRPLRDMDPTEYILGDKGNPIRGADGRMIHVQELKNAANEYYAEQHAYLLGGKVKRTLRDCGDKVLLDLAISDVHTPATLPNYAAGYKIAPGVADIASPPILVQKASDVYYTWDSKNDFNRKIVNGGTPGSNVGEVNPTNTNATYTTVAYSLGGFMPTEIQTNADVPLRPFTKLTQMVVDGLLLEREYRVATLMQTSGSWTAPTTIAAGAQWNGGAASDPIANLHHAIEGSYLPVTGIIWSELVEHDFLRNPGVQKYFTFKNQIDGLPAPEKLSSTLHLPTIYTAKMKYVTGGALTYVWGNHVVLVHEPAERPPTSQMDVATNYTFRWSGGSAPDGSVTGGFLVRTFFDPKRGPRGGTQVVVTHQDAEVQTSTLVGNLLINAHQ